MRLDALAVWVGDHHGRELHPDSRLPVRPEAGYSPVGSWALVLPITPPVVHFEELNLELGMFGARAHKHGSERVQENPNARSRASNVLHNHESINQGVSDSISGHTLSPTIANL